MKRSELKRGKPPVRKVPLRASNPERKARVRGDEVYGPLHRFVSAMPCLLSHTGECRGPEAGRLRKLWDRQHEGGE